ncbi:transient receptor potential cation channel protein painless-like [Anopheles ziemanni]|uniref:transient receptor potential cation channel protein painless-like n=1 Tax=Anopheles coustani TaxID=139045 RepID=UPI002659CE3C|nr:transient receptor potential cation channel protein painless-like [Anopheles coustani]XP_058178554.1 transient receptor potential cation channel protein painless-like [Anopheles ziemanni]
MAEHLVVTRKKRLIASYDANNLQNFIRALDDDGNPYERDRKTGLSLFEQACKTPGKSEYIKACIERLPKVKSDSPLDDIEVNAVNPNTKLCPIHLAALSCDRDNLNELLQCEDVLVDKKFEDRTALFLLFEQITEEKLFEKIPEEKKRAEVRGVITENIKLLLQHDAEINEPNENNVHPLVKLLTGGDDWRKSILEYCIENHELCLDARNKQLRSAIEKHFPDLMKKVRTVGETAVKLLESYIRLPNQEKFISEYRKFCPKPRAKLTQAKRQEMITKALQNRKLLAMQVLMVDLLANEELNDPGPWMSDLLQMCCAYGYVEAVKWFLQIIPRSNKTWINNNPLLVTLVKQMAERPKDSRDDFVSCINLLLEDGRCEIDKRDPLDCTALHHAAMLRIDEAQELLLKKGAYLGSMDVIGKQPISQINSALLERHLDWCIKGNQLYSTNDYKEYALTIDFRNFIPPEGEQISELAPVVQLARSLGPSRELLRHPVIASMLLLKWHLLCRCFYTNIVLCASFFLSFMTYLVLDFHTDSSAWIWIPELISWGGLGYIVLRELFQLMLTWKSYFKSIVNWLEIFLIIICVIVLLRPTVEHGWRQVLSILACGLLTVEFVLLIGTIPLLHISTHIIMLKRVGANFLRLLIPYCVILLPFGVMFHILYQSPHANKSGQTKSWENDTFGTNVSSETTIADSAKDENSTSDDNSFNTFHDILQTLSKISVMFTGEFEAANMHLYESVWRTVLFLVFLFVAFCVLYNVMNGVAVGDTVAILADSELTGIKEKVFLVAKYERQLRRLNTRPKITKLIDWMSWIVPVDGLRLFRHVVGSNTISIKPYQSNVIGYSEPAIEVEAQTCEGSTGTPEEFPLMRKDVEQGVMRTALQRRESSKGYAKRLRLKQMDKQIVERAIEIVNHQHESAVDKGSDGLQTDIKLHQDELKRAILAMQDVPHINGPQSHGTFGVLIKPPVEKQRSTNAKVQMRIEVRDELYME